MSQITAQETGSLNSIGGFTQRKPIDPNALLRINWQAVTQEPEEKAEHLPQVLANVVLIIQALGPAFTTGHPNYEHIKHLLDLDNPIYPPSEPTGDAFKSKEVKLKLPKIKKV